MLVTISYLCALIPLLIGTFIFFAWYITRHFIFLFLGAYTIIIGIVFVLVGLSTLSVYSHRYKEPLWGKRLVIIMLLLLNFPLAATYVYIGYLEFEIEFKILNETDEMLDSFIIQGPKGTMELSAINKGQKVKVFYPQGKGLLKIQVSSSNKKTEYITEMPRHLVYSIMIVIDSNFEIFVIKGD